MSHIYLILLLYYF